MHILVILLLFIPVEIFTLVYRLIDLFRRDYNVPIFLVGATVLPDLDLSLKTQNQSPNVIVRMCG